MPAAAIRTAHRRPKEQCLQPTNLAKQPFQPHTYCPKAPEDTVCDTPSIQSKMRGQVIAGQGYPMLCSLQRVIGPPFRGREEDCLKPREQGNKKSRMNKGFGNKPNTRSHGPGSLGFETLAPNHSLSAIQLWIVCWVSLLICVFRITQIQESKHFWYRSIICYAS